MNRIYLLLLLTVSSLTFSYGQTSSSFHYQSVLRDLTGTVISNEDLGIQVSIIQTLPSNDTVYAELFTSNSGFSGQIDLEIGSGDSILGNYHTIPWGQGSYVVNVAISLGGGTNYTITNTQPLVSVPYALWSTMAGGAQPIRAVKRDKITNPQLGQLVFCSDCGDGELQVYNGSAWVNVAGNAPQAGSVLVQQLYIELLNPYGLNQQLAAKSFPLTARALPDSAADKSVKWSVLETDVASIDQNGILTLLDTGRVTVSAEANDCGGAKATFSYRFVDQKLGNSTPVGVTILGDTAIFINETSLVLAQLDTMYELDTFATWQSFDTSIASISNKGIITAKALGVTQIEVTSSVNAALKDTIPLHVREKQAPFNLIYPTIVVDGYDGDTNIIFIQRYANVPFPGITAIDDIEDTISHIANLYDVNYNAATYNNQLIQDYILIVSAADSFGNNSIDTLRIEVGDSLPPAIVIAGGLSTGDTIISDNSMMNVLPSAYALDEDGDTIAVTINDNGFNGTASGTFLVLYEATDSNGNTASETIVYYISDSLAPTISFAGGLQSGDTILVDQGIAYDINLAIAVDDTGDTLAIEIKEGGFDTLTLGCYVIKYGAIDSSGNADSSFLVAKVRDVTPPEIINRTDFEAVVVNDLDSTPRKIAQVIATDNVGIASYAMEWIPFNENYEGQIYINNSGEIYSTDSFGFVFQASFGFKIYVTDSSGLQDSAIMELITTDGQLKDIRVKQFKDASWVQLARASFNPNSHSEVLKYEYNVGDTVLYFVANNTVVNTFDTLKFDSAAPGAGYTDFDLVRNGNNYYVVLNTAFDTSVRNTYNLKFNIVSRNVTNTSFTTTVPWFLNFSIQSVRVSNPELNDLIPTSTTTTSITLKDILLTGSTSTLACPLSFADSIMGDIADGLDAVITSLPILPADITRKKAKELISTLPAYFWLRRDNGKIRLNAKVPVKGKTIELEYVSDSAQGGGCYWIVLLDKLKPSSVHSRLSILDNDTRAGIVVTTKSITEKDFDCISLPCLKVPSGAHVVAFGKPVAPSGSSNLGSAILDPTVLAVVTPLSSGYSDPALKLTMSMKAEFTAEFNQELVKRMDLSSTSAKLAITAAEKSVDIAQGQANRALKALTGDQLSFDKAKAAYDRAANYLNYYQKSAGNAKKAYDAAFKIFNDMLFKDEICTPNFCILPCYYIGWCSGWGWGYPCTRSCGCKQRVPEYCVPNPTQKLLAAAFGRGTLRSAETALYNANWYLNRAQDGFNYALNIKNIAESALNASQFAFNQAQQGVNAAQSALDQVNINTGDLGKLANYLLKHAMNKSVSTSKITFETTVASVNNGTLTGTLKFDASIIGLPAVSVSTPNFSLNGNNVESAVDAVVTQLIDLIP